MLERREGREEKERKERKKEQERQKVTYPKEVPVIMKAEETQYL